MHIALKILLESIIWFSSMYGLLLFLVGKINLTFKSGRYFKFNGVLISIFSALRGEKVDIISFSLKKKDN